MRNTNDGRFDLVSEMVYHIEEVARMVKPIGYLTKVSILRSVFEWEGAYCRRRASVR